MNDTNKGYIDGEFETQKFASRKKNYYNGLNIMALPLIEWVVLLYGA